MKTIFTFTLLLFAIDGFCQAPEIEWDKIYGGYSEEDVASIVYTSDGGSLIGAETLSDSSFDISEARIGMTDYWILKLDSNNNIMWENRMGGTFFDNVKQAIELLDGGFLIAGSSRSDSSSDKSENAISEMWEDYWVVRLDVFGNILWENTIKGNYEDFLIRVEETETGEIILFGNSYSDSGFDKTEESNGGSDIWIIKLDIFGNIIWDKSFGGDSGDYISDVQKTANNGFILSGNTYSGISGDVTNVTYGNCDYWVLKLDSLCEIEWQLTLGGSSSDLSFGVDTCIDEGYIVGGYSYSGITGNKTSPSFGFYDYWVIKIDFEGNVVWQKTFGGSGTDVLDDLISLPDGGFLLGGSSSSEISGNKTEGRIGSINSDYWIIRLDASGIIKWQNVIGNEGNENLRSLYLTPGNGYVLTGISDSDAGFDKSEDSYKPLEYDIWTVKILPDCLLNSWFYDADIDGYGNPLLNTFGCIGLPGYVSNNLDCYDSNPDINPSSHELCNSLDDNCNGLIDDAITETISISAGGPITFCQGGNVLLTATYSGATVQWKKNGTNIPGATSPTYLVNIKGTYTCVTTSPCGTTLSSPIMVNVIKNPPASITAGGATTFCAGGSVILTANAGGGLSYQWYKGASIIAGATSINYTATLAGNYKCRVTKTATGCFKNSNVIIVSVPCKEGELVNDENAFTIFPNPNDGTFTIEANVKTQDFASSESTIEIYNNLGQLIYSKEINSNDGLINENIEIKNIIPGIYLVKLWNNNIHNVKNIIIE